MLVTNEESHRVLSRALTDRDDGYRRWMRPADIIEQNAIERQPRRSVRLAEVSLSFLQSILRRIREA